MKLKYAHGLTDSLIRFSQWINMAVSWNKSVPSCKVCTLCHTCLWEHVQITFLDQLKSIFFKDVLIMLHSIETKYYINQAPSM